MPFQKITLRPGINVEFTPTLNEAGWSASNGIRWREGLPEKQGGWLELTSTALTGVCRQLHAFEDLSNILYLVAGTDQRLEVFSSDGLTDITPIRHTSNLTSAFSTTSGSATVTIHDVGFGSVAGDWINIPTYYGVGGVVLQGFYQIASAIDADNYTITAGSNATSTVALGGHTSLFNTTNGSSTVTVTLPNHGLAVNDFYTVHVSTAVGGITLSGLYIVQTVPTADTFTITASGGASSTTSGYENSDQANIHYLISSGLASTTALQGYGAGAFGEGTWGESSASSASTPLRIWTLDNFGQNLVASYTGGAVYEWIPPVGLDNPATVVATAPTINAGIFVAMPQAQVIAYGSETGGTQDPLLIRWSDAGDYTEWTAAADNQAGSFRLSKGSTIVGGMQAPQVGLIWTDTDLWAMQYVQPPFIYSFSTLGTGCGLIAQNAATALGRSTYWMSLKGFYSFSDAGVQPMSCSVWDIVFKDLDSMNTDKIIAAGNSLFNEVMWFFPSQSGGTGEIDMYVRMKDGQNGQTWDYGSLVRTAWIDQSIFGAPVGVDADGLMQQHEVAVDANGEIMQDVYVTSGYADLSDGTLFMFVSEIIPDFLWTGSTADTPSVTLTVYAKDYPSDSPRTFGPYTVTDATQYIRLDARARQLAFKIECSQLGVFWRLGAIRYLAAPAGRI